MPQDGVQMEEDRRDGVARNTRDIVVRTEQRVTDLDRSVREFMQEQRNNYTKLSTKIDGRYGELSKKLEDHDVVIDAHEALINKGKGVRWLFGGLVVFAAWLASSLTHFKIF